MPDLRDMNTPIFWAEGHPGPLNVEEWQLEIRGQCENPQIFNWQQLQQMPQTTVEGRLTSVTRWSVGGRWTGIALSTIFNIVEPLPEARFARFYSVGFVYDTTFPLTIAYRDKTLLAYAFNDKPLSEDYGGPIRVFCPYLWGYKSAKSLVRIDLLKNYAAGYWERRGYSHEGEITAGRMLDVNTGNVREIPDGEVLRFLDEDNQ